jgi:hypothetical protein
MILVYPMLTSASVNPTLLPGIIKAVEKYILIHNTDDVLKTFNNVLPEVAHSTSVNVATTLVVAGVGWAAKQIYDKLGKKGGGAPVPLLKLKGKKIELTEQFKQQQMPFPQQSMKDSFKSAARDAAQDVSQNLEKMPKHGSRGGGGITGFEMPRMEAVALEPTWVQVHTSLGAKLIGVKVVPFKVTSTEGMVGLLMSDANLKKMDLLSTKFSRTVMRVFYRIMRGIKVIPGFSGRPISGDPKTDVIWAGSQYGKNMFVCFSQLDLEKDDMFTNPQTVNRLQKLGWASIIVTDDVNKQATFCMKEFGGICSMIPYSFIFSSLGKEHSQVYKDLEDANRSAGPFFRKKNTTRRKLILNK